MKYPVTPDGRYLEIMFENRQLTIYGKVEYSNEIEVVSRQFKSGDLQRMFNIGEAIDASKM